MHKITAFPHSRPSARMLIWGLYAVLCHAVFVMLYSRTCGGGVLDYIQGYKLYLMLEHTLMSLAIVFIGSFALDLALREQKK